MNQTKPKILLTIIKEDIGYLAHGTWGKIHLFTALDDWEHLEEM